MGMRAYAPSYLKKKSTINKLKKTNLFFLDLMLIELPDEHILGYCPGPWG